MSKTTSSSNDIAIVGMACIFPKAPNLQAYWQNIVSKVDAITDPPADRHIDFYYEPESKANDRIMCRRGGYLDPIDFNPIEFGIMPVSVDGAEPEHFAALKVAAAALADAGIPGLPLNRERTEVILGRGTFVNRGYVTLLQHGFVIDQTVRLLKEFNPGLSSGDLDAIKKKLKASIPPFTAETAPGLVSSVMPGIIANRLDLRGRNFAVDAACASALICAEIAAQDLVSRRCDSVLMGAVQVSTPAVIHMLFTQLGALSRQTHLRPFDEKADGTMLGEGVGMIVLKRLEDAVRDGHRIYAVIKSVGTSSDGKAKGLLAPRPEGEELAIRRAYESSGIDAASVELIEAHGTALPVGDATEIETIKKMFSRRLPSTPSCGVGTVKSMFGHLIPAAGVAGLIKAALSVYHRTLPPSINCDKPNPKFELEKTAVYINTEPRPWIHGDTEAPRRAGVNAFGFGGINAHVVMEEFDGPAVPHESYNTAWSTELVVLAAADRNGLAARCEEAARLVAQHPNASLLDIAAALNLRGGDGAPPSKEGSNPLSLEGAAPSAPSCRLAIVASSVQDLAKKLDHAAKRLNDPACRQIRERSGVFFFDEPLGRQGKVAFLFPGEGCQYVNMLADLCIHFPEVRECFDLLDRAFIGHPRNRLPSQFIFPRTAAEQQEAEKRLWSMDGAVDSVITADRALFRLLTTLGVRPDFIVGHSSGEIMALEAAGAVEIQGDDELVQYIRTGNRMIEEMDANDDIPEGLLLTVGGVDYETVTEAVKESRGALTIAMDNCPHQFILCGSEAATSAAADGFRKKGGLCQILPFRRAYHTPLYEKALGPLEAFFNSFRMIRPRVPLYSCLTAERASDDPKEIRELVVRQWARPVRFRETIRNMHRDGVRIFLEVGPRANLTGFVNDILKGESFLGVSVNTHNRPGIDQLNFTLAMLVAHGVPVNLPALYKYRKPRALDAATVAPAARSAMRLALQLPTLNISNEDREKITAGKTAAPASAVNIPPELLAGVSSSPETDQVMLEYFQNMQNFVELQNDVIRAYLEGPPPENFQSLEKSPEYFPIIGKSGPAAAEKTICLRREISLERDAFLRNHTLGGRISKYDETLLALPVVPLSFHLELMIEAAEQAFPGKKVVGARTVRAHRWVTVERDGVTLETTGRTFECNDSPVHLEVRRTDEKAELVAEADLLLADDFSEAPAPADIELKATRKKPIPADRFYPYSLFHGPAMQCVRSLNKLGENGAVASLRVPASELPARPVLTDATGQMAGLWAASLLEKNFVIFPVAIDAIDFYAPPPSPGAEFEGRLQATLKGDGQIQSSVDLIGAGGSLYARVAGLTHKRIDMPRIFHEYRGSRDVMLSEAWDEPVKQFKHAGAVQCCKLDCLPMSFWEIDQRIWRTVLAFIALSANERRQWLEMKGDEQRKTEWLLARTAGKEAVRRLLRKMHGKDFWPADIEIAADANGKPVVGGPWLREIEIAPALSLAHTRGVACALAAESDGQTGVGIDIEPLQKMNADVVGTAFDAREIKLLASNDWKLRAWCAKEAAGKALGTGLGSPRNFAVCKIQKQSGLIHIESKARKSAIPVLTQQSGEFVTAVTSVEVTTPKKAPFIRRVIDLEAGRKLEALCILDPAEDTFLDDHTLGRELAVGDRSLNGLPVVPLTVTMEIMAEAAALLKPGQIVTGMKDIRAYRWIDLDRSPVALKITAVADGSESVGVKVCESDGNGLIAEADVVLAEGFPEAPVADAFEPIRKRKSIWKPEELYTEGMFHGPTFRGVESVEAWGENGSEATLIGMTADRFFASTKTPAFETDAIVLDAAGQLLAYWYVEEHPEIGFNTYPYKVDELRLFGPSLKKGEKARGRVRVEKALPQQLRAHIDVIDDAGRIRMQLIGWEDRPFKLPEAFYRARYKPVETILSHSREDIAAEFKSEGLIECCTMADYPDSLLHAHGLIWLKALAHTVLSRNERELWQALEGSEKEKTEWLLERIAAKDAVRLHLRKSGVRVGLTDVDIQTDSNGQATAQGAWARKARKPFSLWMGVVKGSGVAAVFTPQKGRNLTGITNRLKRML